VFSTVKRLSQQRVKIEEQDEQNVLRLATWSMAYRARTGRDTWVPGVHPVRGIRVRWMGGSCYGWTLRNAESVPPGSEPCLADVSVVFERCGWGEVSSCSRRIFEWKSGRDKHVFSTCHAVPGATFQKGARTRRGENSVTSSSVNARLQRSDIEHSLFI
jgi:hypothetical protein